MGLFSTIFPTRLTSAYQHSFEVQVDVPSNFTVGKRVKFTVKGRNITQSIKANGIFEVCLKTKNDSQFALEGDTKCVYSVC